MLTKDVFGKTTEGQEVERFTFLNKNGVQVQIITYGARITSIRTPDRCGVVDEITFGFDSIKDYENDQFYFGAIMGRVVGRVANGEFTLDGKQYRLPLNSGHHHVHGGFSEALWTPEIIEQKLILTLISEDNDEGYPGTLSTKVTFDLTDDNELCIEATASSTKPTPVNLTYHPYFNLDLKRDGNIYNHVVSINADHYVVIDSEVIPTGEIAKVEGTLYDLRSPVVLGERVPHVNGDIGYDNCFCLNKTEFSEKSRKQLAARVELSSSGRYVEAYTTKPGLNFYNSYYATGVTERGGHVIGSHGAVCFETQHFPDSVHHPTFPSIIVSPDKAYKHSCSYKFGVI